MTDKLKNILIWTGAFLAGAGAIAYFVITLIFVVGVEKNMDTDQRLIFAIISALSGAIISISLMFQGLELSKKENEEKMNEYYSFFYKEKKKLGFRDSLWFYVITKVLNTILFKALGVAASTYMVIWIMIEGNGDISLVFNALANIIMFTGFGMMSMSGSYNFHSTRYMRLIQEKINRLKNNKTMTPPSVEEQGENNEISRKEIPEPAGTGGHEQEGYKTLEGREVCDIHDGSSDTELNVSDIERTNDNI